MNKKNKWLIIGAIVVALSIFTVTALASTALASKPNTAGYDAFKEVLKENHMSGVMIRSATANGSITVNVNGESVLEANGMMKVDDAGDVSSDFEFTVQGVERSGSVYSSEDNEVYFVDQTHNLYYQVINLDNKQVSRNNEWRDEYEFHNRSMNKAEEALLDFLIGDLKKNFSVMNHSDGSKTIMLDVSKEEIPLPLRLLVNVASSVDKHKRTDVKEVSAEWEQLKQIPFFEGLEGIGLEEHMPELTDDVAIEHVRLNLSVDVNNKLQNVQGELAVGGKDVAGVTHRVVISGEGKISNINATKPDVFNPIGKSIEIIDAEVFCDL